MTAFEKLKISEDSVTCTAYVGDHTPGYSVNINLDQESYGTVEDEYNDHMAISKDVWYLTVAVNSGFVTNGQSIKILDNCPNKFDPAFIMIYD